MTSNRYIKQDDAKRSISGDSSINNVLVGDFREIDVYVAHVVSDHLKPFPLQERFQLHDN